MYDRYSVERALTACIPKASLMVVFLHLHANWLHHFSLLRCSFCLSYVWRKLARITVLLARIDEKFSEKFKQGFVFLRQKSRSALRVLMFGYWISNFFYVMSKLIIAFLNLKLNRFYEFISYLLNFFSFFFYLLQLQIRNCDES